MIILGIILLIVGFVAKIAILWTIGIIVLVIGAILAIVGVDRPAHRWPQTLVLNRRRGLPARLRSAAAVVT